LLLIVQSGNQPKPILTSRGWLRLALNNHWAKKSSHKASFLTTFRAA